MPRAPWWTFALAPADRADPEANRLLGDDGAPLVNAPDPDGRHPFAYADYIGLSSLLGAGDPTSTVPDERAFLTVHQLCEVAFKQMTFDLAVIASTFERVHALPEAERRAVALAEGDVDDERSPESAHWRPAITAASRLRHCAGRLLPRIMELVGANEDGDVLFSSIEFNAFRPHLTPTSGFQTAQLRLVQRGLGKGPVLDLRVFPDETFSHHYDAPPCGHVGLADPVVLRDSVAIATPSDDHPSALATRVDAAAHALLGALASGSAPPPAPIPEAEVERVVQRFRSTLGPEAGGDGERATERFAEDLAAAITAENERRAGLGRARAAATAVRAEARDSALVYVLDRVRDADEALHGPASASFLSVHRRTARRQVADGSGTGGGGMPYLVTSQRYLLPLFPALVAYREG
ncbi:MAG: hypothetical protein AAF845_18275 [Bacteroidota bacterium]